MNNPDIALDNLFREAKTAAKRVAAKKKEIPPETPLSTWENPDNWKHSRYLVLIQKETQKALGVFSELLHVKQQGCRKLVSAPDQKPDAVEYISGEWEVKTVSAESQHKHIKLVANYLVLAKLEHVAASNFEVDLHFAYGKLAGVRLERDTTFARGAIIYSFPRGIDVFLLLGYATITTIEESYHGN